jgi:hypothetical protein
VAVDVGAEHGGVDRFHDALKDAGAV